MKEPAVSLANLVPLECFPVEFWGTWMCIREWSEAKRRWSFMQQLMEIII